MAGVQHNSALLLKDIVGDKGGGLWFNRKKKDVLRGSLLVGITTKEAPADGKPAYNFKVASDDVLMFCTEQDVAPLTNREFDLLAGIKSPGARYDIFIKDILDLGTVLKVNDKVFVALPTRQAIANETSKAIVRWIGYLPNDRGEGIHFGVEILEEQHRGKGSTDGFFRGEQLFRCNENCGLVVSLDWLAPTADKIIKRPEATHSAEPTKTFASRLGLGKSNETQHSSSSRARQGAAAGTRSQAQENNLSQFRIGDHVVAYNKDQIPIHGVVKWTGEINAASGVKIKAVGIETNVSVQKGEFSVTFPSYVKSFKCDDSKHGKVVLPESMVQLEKDRIQEKQHEEIHRCLEQNEQKMLREAKLKKEDLNPSEQEKLFHEYNQQRDEKIRDKKLEGVNNVDSTSQQDISRSSIPRQCSTQERVTSTTSTGLEKSHMYDVIIPHSNSAGNLLQQQPQHNNPPANVHVQEEAMLREAKIETRAFDRAEQQRMLQEYNLQRDRDIQRKIEVGGTRGTPGSGSSQHGIGTSVDPTPTQDQSDYQNLPMHSNPKAFAPQSKTIQQNLAMNSQVQFSDPPRYGVIRWMGDLPEVSGLIAGVELEEDMEGCEDGFWKEKRYFSCKFGRAFFSPVSNLKPDQRVVTAAGQTPPMIHAPNIPAPGYQDPPQGTTHGYREPTHSSSTVAPGLNDLSTPAFGKPTAQGFTDPQGFTTPANVSKGSAVEIGDPRDPHYGTIRWIGNLPGHEEVFAGVEMEEDTQSCRDGFIHGVQYFQCRYGRGYFCTLSNVRIDRRFADSAPPQGLSLKSGNPLQVPLEEPEDQQVPPLEVYLGEGRGIQGNQNSCYLDSTLFGLFALIDIFDEMFLEMATNPNIDANRKAVSGMLWKGIVNPLRRNGVVRYESVMMMRNKLEELGKMEGITEKEKDPEEFLNMLFKHVLQTPAFIFIRRPFGVEKEFFVQLFVEHDPTLQLPTVEELIQRMFKEQQISFTKIPSKLLLQVPRFGREFKTYKKVIPNLRLDILEVTDTVRVPECMFCGERSVKKCSTCKGEFSAQVHDGCVYFCSTCSARAHQKKDRKSHALQPAIDKDKLELYKLDLLSVICIETSHYVCFTKDPRDETWIFFDSMANRVYDTYNIPRVTDCTDELNEWVYSGDRTRLMSTQPRQLPELVRRFTQDIYMCVYIQPDVAMYGDPDGQ